VILDRDREAADRRVARRSLRHRPGIEHTIELKAEIEVEARGRVLLDDKAAALGWRDPFRLWARPSA
jgi:hypothetical protein